MITSQNAPFRYLCPKFPDFFNNIVDEVNGLIAIAPYFRGSVTYR